MPEGRSHGGVERLLGRLDRIRVPDRWDDVLDRSDHPPPPVDAPSPFRRVAVVAVALVIAAAGFGLLVTVFQVNTPAPAGGTVSSSMLVEGGKIRCTATLPTPLRAGQDTGMRFTVTNVTDKPVKASFEDGTMGFVLTAADGTVFDSRYSAQHASVPPVLPKTIAPGASYHPHVDDALVRWGGPVVLTPECLGHALPPLHAAVRAPGPPQTDSQAIGLVARATHHLLDACRPTRSGVPTIGRIDAPAGSTPPMNATCSITLRPEGNFVSAQVLIVAPPGLPGVGVKPPYDQVVGLGKGQHAEVVSWDFVVTKDAAIPVYSNLQATWPTGPLGLGAGTGMVEFRWTGSRWVQDGQVVRCGSRPNARDQRSGEGGGGSGAEVSVPITWRCH